MKNNMAKFKDFKEFRKAILDQGAAAKWCDSKEATMVAIDSYEGALQLVHENPRECFDTGLLGIDIIERIPDEVMRRNRIFLNEDCDSGLCLVTKGNVKIGGDALAYAHNEAIVVANGRSKIRAYDGVKVTAEGNVKVRIFGSNNVVATGSCFVIKEAGGTVRASGSVVVASYSMDGVELSGGARFKKLARA